MLIHECEGLAVQTFLHAVGTLEHARRLQWNGQIKEQRSEVRFSRYASEFQIRGSDGLVTKTSSVPLFEDGRCLHSADSLKQAFDVAVSETAIAVREPPRITPALPLFASSRAKV